MAFISGQYTAVLGGNSVGQIEAGITLEHRFFSRLLKGNNWAQTPQDSILTGAEMMVSYNLLESNQVGANNALWPYGTTYLNFATAFGRKASSYADTLVLTALTDTPAFDEGAPLTLTLSSVILAEDYPLALLFAPDLRVVPIRQRVLPLAGIFGVMT